MSTMLRGPWVSAFICEKLKDAIAKREGAGIEVLDNIGPLGELQLPGDRFRALQVIQFLSFEDPITAVLSDKSVKITCKFSSGARSKHEASNGRMTTIKGGIIKITSYQIRFFGVDGILFWKGGTYQDQIGNEPTSRKTGKGSKHNSRSSVGSSRSTAKDWGKGDTNVDFELVPKPEPVLYITDFTYIGSAGEPIFGNPGSISSRTDINELLLDLPRKKYSKEETEVGFKQDSRSMGNKTTVSQQWKEGKSAKGHRGTQPPPRNPSRKGASLRHPQSTHGSDDEIRSQPQVNSDDVSSEGVSQLPFATQAPPHFSSTFDDLEFSTQRGQKKNSAKSPPSSPPTSSLQSTGHSPQVVIIRKSQGKKNESRPNQARKNAESTKRPGIKSKFINYADDTEFEESTVGSMTEGGRQSRMLKGSTNRHKRKRSGIDDVAVTDSGLLEVTISAAHRGWQGMTEVTKKDTVIPKDQQEVLDHPESWYPYKNTHHTSGYDLVPKVQLVPKSHPPRDRQMPIQVVAPVTATRNSPSPTLSSDDEPLPWSSSPVRPSKKDINTMPPDSSMPSGSQPQRAGRWSMQVKQGNSTSTQGSSTCDSLSLLCQVPIQREIGIKTNKISPVQSSSEYSDGCEEISEYSGTGKRITRAANGISKKILINQTNVEPLRIAKASQRPKTAARKRRRNESQQEDESSEDYETSEDEQINELINNPDLPVDVVNPNGRTRVAVFGGILKAQQVEMWEKDKKKREQNSGNNTEDETSSDEGGVQNGSGGGKIPGEQPGSTEENGVGNDALEFMKFSMPGSSSVSKDKLGDEPSIEAQNVDSHPRSRVTPEPENDPMDIAEMDEHILNAVQPTNHSEIIEPLPSESNHSTHLEDKVPEPSPDLSLELPVVEQMDFDIDVITQAPAMPLNLMMRAKAKISSVLKQHSPYIDQLEEGPTKLTTNDQDRIPEVAITDDDTSLHSKEKPQATGPGDSRSTAIYLETSSAPEVLNLPGNQNPTRDFTSSIPSTDSNVAPTIQVQETPYRKGGSRLGTGQCLSPTNPKSRTGPENFGDEFDDIGLVPGTNTQELHNSRVPTPPQLGRQSTPEQDSSPPERQLAPLNHISSSAEGGISGLDFPHDLATSQLQREFLENMDVEVPATSEVEETRIEDDDRLPHSSSQGPSKPSKTKTRKLIKIVDFQSQEIRAANAHHVPTLLEKQKREFMGLENLYDFADLEFEGNKSPLRDEGSRTLPKGIEVGSSPTPSVMGHQLIELDDKGRSDFSQSDTRKRNQSPPLEAPKSVKKPRANSKSSYEISNYSASVSPPHLAIQERVETTIKPQNESRPNSNKTESFGKGDPEPGDDDPMADFPNIVIGTDDEFEPSWPPQTNSGPEMYAGIRERHLYVPGYGKLTDAQKEELDRRRQEYFGIKTSTERLFSVELQRAMQNGSSLSLSRVANSKATERVKPKDEWYRDENTPVKVFYRKFKELKQVKLELAAMERGGVSDGI